MITSLRSTRRACGGLPESSRLRAAFSEESIRMSELDEAWALALAEAERRARTSGRTDVAQYLALRNSNDLLRKTGIDWLTQTVLQLAGKANRAGASIQIANDEQHRFHAGNATMVGTRLTLTFGLRALSVEAGWPRTPKDGFIRGGGLACGKLIHRGIKSASEELQLVRSPAGIPRWLAITKEGKGIQMDELRLKTHLAILLDYRSR
jgi:hypothetical protein